MSASEKAWAEFRDANPQVNNPVARAAFIVGFARGETSGQPIVIWYPLFDTPVTVTLSREQLQCVQGVLAGRPEPVPGWSGHFAGEIEKVLQRSLDAEEDGAA